MQASDIPVLDKNELRKFGLSTGAILAAIFGGFIPWVWELKYPLWPWIIFGILGALALVAPMSLQPVHRTWMRFGLLISKVTTPIIMGVIFFLLFMPVGLIMRLIGKDPLRRSLDDSINTYRVRPHFHESESLEKPY
jgi:hypothetical protein